MKRSETIWEQELAPIRLAARRQGGHPGISPRRCWGHRGRRQPPGEVAAEQLELFHLALCLPWPLFILLPLKAVAIDLFFFPFFPLSLPLLSFPLLPSSPSAGTLLPRCLNGDALPVLLPKRGQFFLYVLYRVLPSRVNVVCAGRLANSPFVKLQAHQVLGAAS